METACSASVMFRSKAGSCDEPEALHSIRRNVFYVGVCGGICGSLDFPSAMLELGYFAGSEMRFDCASLLLCLLEQPRWLLQDGVCAAGIWLVQHCRQLYAPSQHDLLACIVVKHAGYQAEAQFARFFHFGTVSYLFWIAHGSARRSEMRAARVEAVALNKQCSLIG